MIDSHCHLDYEPLLSNLDKVIQRSKDIGIKKLLTISTSFESFSKIKDIVNKDEIIYGTVGIHPHESNTNKITKNEIINSYKKIMKKIHPDVSPELARLATIVNEAKDTILKDIV